MKKSLKKFKLPLDWATNPNLCDGRMQQDTLYNILPSYPNVKPKVTLSEQVFLFATGNVLECSARIYQGIYFY